MQRHFLLPTAVGRRGYQLNKARDTSEHTSRAQGVRKLALGLNLYSY